MTTISIPSFFIDINNFENELTIQRDFKNSILNLARKVMNVNTQKELDSAVKTYQKRQQQINKVFLKPHSLGSIIGKPQGNYQGNEYFSSLELMEVNRHIMRGNKTIPIATHDINSKRFMKLVALQARKANPNKQYALKLEHHTPTKKYRRTIIGQPSYYLLFSFSYPFIREIIGGENE